MTTGSYLLGSFLAVLLYMTALFAVALLRKDNSVADIGWGIGFLVVWAVTFLLEPGGTRLQVLAGGLVAAWGIRLSGHIFFRNRGRGEDFRYTKWRRQWGRSFVLRSYLQVFLLQGVFMLLISTPIIFINRSSSGAVGAPAVAGSVVWLIGFVFESVGDGQLRRFKKDPASRGRVMTRGLWRYTRHPNYFGESLMWWGLFIVGLSVAGGWAGLVSPLLLTFLLTRVSGIPLLEKKYRGNPEFEEYARRTSAFIPWPPKREGGLLFR
jgi:steroid 5-alpha reductase family enzyme